MGMDVILIEFVNSTAGHHLPCHRRFQWQTEVVRLSGGSRLSQRNQILEQPIRHWWINFRGLLASEQSRFLEIFNRAKGGYDTFLVYDTDPGGDYQCEAADWSYTAAVGETETQLQKTYYKGETEAWTEDKIDIAPSSVYVPRVWLDSVEKTEGTHFTLDDSTGLVDWTGGGAPHGAMAGGEIIQADYRFYYRVRCADDLYDQMRNVPKYFEVMGLHLVEDR